MDESEGGEPDPTNAIDVLRCFRCGHEGCTNVPSWGYDREGPTLCSEHATTAMVQVVELCCQEPSCNARRTFGFDGAAAQLCATHKKENMVDLMKRRSQCIVPNCTKLSTYGFEGFLARFCFSHKSGGMVYLKNRKRCEYYECTRQPTYGMDGQQAKFCSSHKEEGMVDVKNCRCKHPGCTRQPNYGHEGGRAKYCSSHKMTGMINVVSRRCEYPDCKRQPIYGFEGEKATYCPQHRSETMVDVVNRHCEYSGCTKTPSYGYEKGRAQFCSNHHLPEMTDVKNRRCEWHECRRYPFYGHEGERARFCSEHKIDGMVNVRNRRCEENCSRPPTHGFLGGKAQACVGHTKPGMVNLKDRKGIIGESGMYGHESDVDRHGKGGGSSMTGLRRQASSGYRSDPRGVLGGMHKKATGDRLLRPGAYLGMGSRGAASAEDLGHGMSQERMYSGQGAQGRNPVMGWGETGGILREGGGSSGGMDAAAPLSGVLSQQRSFGSTSYSDDATKGSRRFAMQTDLPQQARGHTPPLQSVERHYHGRSLNVDPNDQFYGQTAHGQTLHPSLPQQPMTTPQRSQGHPQSTPQASMASGRSLETPYHDVRPLHHGYREQGQRERERERKQEHQPQESRAYSSSSFAGLGVGDNEPGSGRVSGVLGGRATLPLPQSRLSMAQPRARRPRPSSPGRGVHDDSEGELEAALEGGRRGESSSPFVGNQPSAPLRLPLPSITPSMSGSFPSSFQPLDWSEPQGGVGGLSSGGAGDGRGGVGGGDRGSAWSRDVSIPMGNVDYPYQVEEPTHRGEQTGEMAIGGGEVRGGAAASSSQLEMNAPAGTNEGGFDTRLSSVDLGSGLIQPFDRVQGMGSVRDPPSGSFPGIGQEVTSGGRLEGERLHFSSPSGYVDDSAVVGGPVRPLSPLMAALGDTGESPPGLPRLRNLDERTQGSQMGASYSSHNLPTSSALLPSQSLPGLQQNVPSAAVRMGPDQGLRAFDALTDQRGEGVLGATESGPSSGAGAGGMNLDAAVFRQGHGGARLGAGEGWVSAGGIGEGSAPDAGEGAPEGDDDDPRKRLRIEELLH